MVVETVAPPQELQEFRPRTSKQYVKDRTGIGNAKVFTSEQAPVFSVFNPTGLLGPARQKKSVRIGKMRLQNTFALMSKEMKTCLG